MTKVAASKEKVNNMRPITAHFNNHTAHVSFNNPLEQVIISLYLILSLSSGLVLRHLTESSIITTSEINLYGPFFTLTKKTNTVCMLARFNVSK